LKEIIMNESKWYVDKLVARRIRDLWISIIKYPYDGRLGTPEEELEELEAAIILKLNGVFDDNYEEEVNEYEIKGALQKSALVVRVGNTFNFKQEE
jgi:hypothetical protein